MYLTYTPEAGELEDETLANIEVVEEELLKRDDIDIVQLSVTDSSDPMAAMMGGGSGGALMYLIFDPMKWKTSRKFVRKLKSMSSILVNLANGRAKTSLQCLCLQMKSATHSTVKI